MSRDLLAGVRVVELSRMLAAPLCGLTLADLGADVVKVEPPGGDETRAFPPFLAPGESGFFHAVNRGKRGVVLKLGSADAVDAVRRLVLGADVVVENLGLASDRLGISYEEAASENPRLVWCSITGFGADAPERGGRAVDPSLQAAMGMMALTGEPDRGPLRVPVPLVDLMTGMYAAQQVLTALWRVERGERGAFLDCAMVDAAATLTGFTAMLPLSGMLRPRRLGADSFLVVPSSVFDAQDGVSIQLIAITERQWRSLCEVLGHPEWTHDPRMASNDARLEHRDLVHALVAEELSQAPAAEWVERMSGAGVIAEPVREIEEAWADPLLEARGLLGRLPGMDGFPVPVVSLARTADAGSLSRGPFLGEHTDEILRTLR